MSIISHTKLYCVVVLSRREFRARQEVIQWHKFSLNYTPQSRHKSERIIYIAMWHANRRGGGCWWRRGSLKVAENWEKLTPRNKTIKTTRKTAFHRGLGVWCISWEEANVNLNIKFMQIKLNENDRKVVIHKASSVRYRSFYILFFFPLVVVCRK